MAHRGYTDEGSVFVGFWTTPTFKRELVDHAHGRGDSLSAYLRARLGEHEPQDQQQRDHSLAAA